MAVANPETERPTDEAANDTNSETTGTPATDGTAAEASTTKRPALHLNVAPELGTALAAKVKELKLPQAGIIRTALYEYLKLEMPKEELTAGTKIKYATPEDRVKATKDRNEEVKNMLKLSQQARAMGINLSDLLAQAAAKATAGDEAEAPAGE